MIVLCLFFNLQFLFPDAREASVKTKGMAMTSSGCSTISNSEVTDGIMTSSTSEQDLQTSEILGCQFKVPYFLAFKH